MHLLAETLKGPDWEVGGGGAIPMSVCQLQGVFPAESMLRSHLRLRKAVGDPSLFLTSS